MDQTLLGVTECPGCKWKSRIYFLTRENKFKCGHCGLKFTINTCKCGIKNYDTVKFCPGCGKKNK